MPLVAPSRKSRLGDLLRNTASAFVRETAATPEEDTHLRSEIDCLLALWIAGDIQPVAEFMDRHATPLPLSPTPPISPSSSPEIPLH